jgi:hypothetical protein
MAIKVGREMLPMLLNELKPLPQERQENVASFHARVHYLRAIHKIYHRLNGTPMVNTEQFDTQLKQGYRSSLTNDINEKIAARIAEQQVNLPAGENYVPTVNDGGRAASRTVREQGPAVCVNVAAFCPALRRSRISRLARRCQPGKRSPHLRCRAQFLCSRHFPSSQQQSPDISCD